MDKNEALSLARQALRSNGIVVGTDWQVDYHPEGGKSLDNVHRIPNYQSILNVPYYEIRFKYVPREPVSLGAFGSLIVIVFENQRVLVVPPDVDIVPSSPV